MDNTYTHTDGTQSCDSGSCDSGSKGMDLRSFAAGFVLAAAFFTIPLYTMTEGLSASVVGVQETDADGDGIPDRLDVGKRPVEEEEVACEPSDVDEDGVVDENEGCDEEEVVEEEAIGEEASDTEETTEDEEEVADDETATEEEAVEEEEATEQP